MSLSEASKVYAEKKAAYEEGYNDGFYDGYEAASSGEIGTGTLDVSDYRDKLSAPDWIKLTADWAVAEDRVYSEGREAGYEEGREAGYAEGYKAADQSAEIQALTEAVGKTQKIMWVYRGISLLSLLCLAAMAIVVLKKTRKKKKN